MNEKKVISPSLGTIFKKKTLLVLIAIGTFQICYAYDKASEHKIAFNESNTQIAKSDITAEGFLHQRAFFTSTSTALQYYGNKSYTTDWYFFGIRTTGYTYQNGYPLGFHISPLITLTYLLAPFDWLGLDLSDITDYLLNRYVPGITVAFKLRDVEYKISDTETRVPKWAIHMNIEGAYGTEEFHMTYGIRCGINFAERNYYADNHKFSANTAYFGFSPIIGLGYSWVYAFIGYEIVPAFSQINGLTLGVGLNF